MYKISQAADLQVIDQKVRSHKYADITSKVIGSSMEAHRILKNGFQEVIYQRALEKEMLLQGLHVQREYEMPIFYKGEKVGGRRVDFLVEGVIPVEIKAIAKLEDVHLAQAVNYLEAYNLEIGLLLNFGSKSLEFRRLINPKYKS
ncbi:GxxExxY protein [Pontibacter cellulosilyticus]|uniref:GxxExxY protein n=1 Tax=Pontibacter cellulosilyticus TaxID=1720253 RepID=A0A923N716_9BACT|nr:GxxExxY protein [Pontibacter cellulosilyticus]MBC5993364.1 GxxExxY protein [Pontibacter cellulosilyticus]